MRRGHITKQGSTLVRWAAIEAARKLLTLVFCPRSCGAAVPMIERVRGEGMTGTRRPRRAHASGLPA